jgi:hypothetical protein
MGAARVVGRVRGRAMQRVEFSVCVATRGYRVGWTNRGDQEGDGDGLLCFCHTCDRRKEFYETGLDWKSTGQI